MAILYGVANHSPEQFYRWVESEYSINHLKHVTQVPVNGKLNLKKKYKRILVFLSLSDFHRNVPILNEKPFSNKHIFIFASPVRLHEISNINMLDTKPSTTAPGYGYTLSKVFLPNVFDPNAKSKEPISKADRTFLTRLINKVQKGSLLNALMTCIYTLKGAAQQKPVNSAVCAWLYYGGDAKKLDKMFTALKGEVGLTQNTRDKLHNILVSDVGEGIQKSFEVIRDLRERGKSIPYDKIAEKFGVSPFELRYIRSRIDNDAKYASQEKKSIDDFINEKNKG